MFFYTVLTSITTTSGLWSTGKTRKYHQIDVYIYQGEYADIDDGRTLYKRQRKRPGFLQKCLNETVQNILFRNIQ